MALTSFKFFAFAIALIIVYFAVPKKWQWVVLLAGSMFFYLTAGWKNVFFILITSVSAFFAAKWIDRIAGNKEIEKNKRKRYKRWVLAGTLILNFGLLCTFKYLNFFIEQINSVTKLLGADPLSAVSLIIPLGISFYTFQTMGYLADVYWEKTKPQTNVLKLLLFTSFFPQITQGPISNYNQLSTELFTEHSFEYKRFAWGAQRFIWGFLKKAVCADVAAYCVKDVFANYGSYTGLTTLLGAFLYSVQIYADFSGYMDMACGLCEVMGIKLMENFERPYFSKSVAEYWRRWHISLGAWFKDYIYYPISMSKKCRKLAKSLKKKAGKRVGDAVPSTIALLVTWFVTGLWHGANWAYIVWGLVNGLFIILQVWLQPFYDWSRAKLHVKEKSFIWKLFITLRTFFLVTLIKVLPEVGTLGDGLGLWKRIFTNFTLPHSLMELMPYADDKAINMGFMTIMIILIFIADLLQRKKPVREYYNKLPMIIRIVFLAAAFVAAVSFGVRVEGGGFLYANF